MNQELIETMLNNILQDISQLKKDVEELKKSKPKNNFSHVDPKKPATQAQLDAVAIRGGQVWQGMTHQDITNQFNEISNRKNQPIEKSETEKKIDQAIEKLPEVKEPKQVDTDDAGLTEGLM